MVLDLYSNSSHSLKGKRHIVSSIKDRLRQKYNVSIIESGHQDLWQKIQLAVAMVSTSRAIADKVFIQIEDFILENYPVQPVSIDKEFI